METGPHNMVMKHYQAIPIKKFPLLNYPALSLLRKHSSYLISEIEHYVRTLNLYLFTQLSSSLHILLKYHLFLIVIFKFLIHDLLLYYLLLLVFTNSVSFLTCSSDLTLGLQLKLVS